MKDYYKILGIDKNASDEEIKKAYRKIAKENHPDLHPGDKVAEEKFKDAAEAYSVLSNPTERKKYDGSNGDFYGSFSDMGDFGGFYWDKDPFDIYKDIFNFGNDNGERSNFYGKKPKQKGTSLRISISVSLLDVLNGITKKVKVRRTVVCTHCNGSGSEDGSQETCKVCGGTGFVKKQKRTILGYMSTNEQCDNCNGTGKITKNKCTHCNGSGVERIDDIVEITIPKGVLNGETLTIYGKGNAGANGGEYGDLYVNVSVMKNEQFERDDCNLIKEQHIDNLTAILGGKVEIGTLTGKVRVDIKEGTQSHTQIRLRDKGLPKRGSTLIGDLVVNLIVDVPTKLSKDERKLYEQLKEMQNSHN